ncbi:hypothetical protein CU098_008182 [Rhizopus stolonifer]|uniref:Uncharacterized protein n=1 Tax=Rhizopus stolonifer TaxID=4846 RepID=A0A367K950_RHIST|nr:hypothetical protein CU098_008182 [Rhizopus stolonifer]
MKLSLISILALAGMAAAATIPEASSQGFLERLLHVDTEAINDNQMAMLARIKEAQASEDLCVNAENKMLCTMDSLVKSIAAELESYGIPNAPSEIDTAKFDEVLGRLLGVVDPAVFGNYQAYVVNMLPDSFPHDEFVASNTDENSLFIKIADEMYNIFQNVPNLTLSKLVAPFLVTNPEAKAKAIHQLIQNLSIDEKAISETAAFKEVKDLIDKKVAESKEKGEEAAMVDLSYEGLLDLMPKADVTEAASKPAAPAVAEGSIKAAALEVSAKPAAAKKEAAKDEEEEEVDEEVAELMADADAIEAEVSIVNIDEEEEEEEEEEEAAEEASQAPEPAQLLDIAQVDEKGIVMRAVLRTTLGDVLDAVLGLVGDIGKLLGNVGVDIGANISVGGK